MVLGFLRKPQYSVRFTVFGMSHPTGENTLKMCLAHLKGILNARLDTRRNIGFVEWDKQSNLTKHDILSAIFSKGYAAEELR